MHIPKALLYETLNLMLIQNKENRRLNLDFPQTDWLKLKSRKCSKYVQKCLYLTL